MTDLDLGMDLARLLGIVANHDRMDIVTINGAPWSKSRPRFARGRTYTAREDADAEKRTLSYLTRVKPYTGNVALGCVFFRPNRQRIDADNLLKHVCDAANGVIWADDSQITAIMGRVELDPANPRTVVVIGEHISTLTRGTDFHLPCPVCGTPVPNESRVTCSMECSLIYRGYQSLAEPVPCKQCGKPFVRQTKTRSLCSDNCRVEWLRGARKKAARPFSRCFTCGKELAHRRDGQCRDCWKATRPAKTRSANAS